jgi:hypothetical protein
VVTLPTFTCSLIQYKTEDGLQQLFLFLAAFFLANRLAAQSAFDESKFHEKAVTFQRRKFDLF